MNAPRLLYVHPTKFMFSRTSGNGLAANSFAFKSVAAVVSDIPQHWVCPNSLYWVRGYSARLHYVKEWFGIFFLPLSPLCFFFFFSKMPRLELAFSESKFAACQSGTLSRVSRAFRFPDSDSRAKCVRSIKLSLIPNPNTPRKACFKSVVVKVSKLGSLHTFGEYCLISHVWWILSQTTFWMDLRGRRLIYINS